MPSYQCYAGPADGIDLLLDPEMQHLEYVYLQLPIKGKQVVYKEPPRAPYTRYRLGVPTVNKCQWAGDYKETA